MGDDVVAVDLNPMNWLGDAASAAAADVWKAAMISIWSAGLWLLTLSFKVIDAFTTPDVSAEGPMGRVLPTTLWFGASVAVTMMFVQLTVALLRRDGRSLGRVLAGVGQFGLVWVGYLGMAGGLVAAAAGLSRGVLRSMLDVDSLTQFDPSSSWPREVVDTTAATVLGFSSLLLVVPAAFLYLVIMLVREAALIILIATAPIAAAGLVSDSTKSWFWKSLRWFFSCLLIAPMAALVLGIGVQLSAGVVAGNGDSTAQAAGTAVIGAVMVAIGAVCPLVVFRLLAFVDPGTASGSALRQSWGDAGGLSGVVSGGRQHVGSAAASQSGGDGRSQGEAAAEAQSVSRLSSMLGTVGSAAGAGTGAAASLAHRAVDIASDVLGSSGVGHPGYRTPPAHEPSRHRSNGGAGASRSRTSSADGAGPDGPASDGGGLGHVPLPEPPMPPAPSSGLSGWARDSEAMGGAGKAAAAGAAL
ncbi:type IV secretion system protein [Modestobacter altitudinis]|uniref:type IV secretion system protein n=1 Tax=Modestobacter altitudinis TaxID=2213158 RepID=UPI00110C9E95|nr:type IV secretion system protein [Modestobacter altitudinis]